MDTEALIRWAAASMDARFTPPAYDAACAATTLRHAGRSAEPHGRFLQRWNGAYALDGALHVFGALHEPPNQSLDLWNLPSGWRQGFGIVLEGLWFFAEDAFGNQFAYRDEKVVRLRIHDARVEPVAPDFVGWLEAVLLDPQRWLALDVFNACVRTHGPLPPGGHFGLKPGAEASRTMRPDALEVLPARDNLELRAASWTFGTTRSAPRAR